ncbi:hypothetical protein DITRI_Ditri08aG0083800 [Diplodiscus trichospermus]
MALPLSSLFPSFPRYLYLYRKRRWRAITVNETEANEHVKLGPGTVFRTTRQTPSPHADIYPACIPLPLFFLGLASSMRFQSPSHVKASIMS